MRNRTWRNLEGSLFRYFRPTPSLICQTALRVLASVASRVALQRSVDSCIHQLVRSIKAKPVRSGMIIGEWNQQATGFIPRADSLRFINLANWLGV